MFEKLNEINFEEIKLIDFQPPKIKRDFSSYFKVTEKIYGYFRDLGEYSELIIDADKTKLNKDITAFVNIHKNIQNQTYKRADGRLKKDFFNQNYINWLKNRISLYSHFSSELEKQQGKFDGDSKKIIDEHSELLQAKESSIEEITGEKEKLQKRIETQRETIEKKNSEITEKKLQIEDQELNKLAKSFGDEEIKYKEGSKNMIYIGFMLLVIPSLTIIFFLLGDIFQLDSWLLGKDIILEDEIYLLAVPFTVLTIILWYFQYFQLKNYYINRDLETNFANRKAVANSFRGLLEMVNEEQSFQDNPEVKSNFFDKVSSILYSEIDTSYIKKHNDNVPISKLLDTVNELIKKVK